MTDTLARNNQYSAGMMIAESLKAGDDAAPLSDSTSDVSLLCGHCQNMGDSVVFIYDPLGSKVALYTTY